LQACNGGCPKQRFALSSDGKPNKHYLCEGFRIHLSHVVPALCVAEKKGVANADEERDESDVAKPLAAPGCCAASGA